MIIVLKNNRKLDLKWNFLVLEYLEEYSTNDGSGISQLQKDIKNKKNQLKIYNYFTYAIIRANIDKPLTYREAINLVPFKDYNKIVEFIEKNLHELEEFKKKDVKYIPAQNKKKKR